jgi:hypothetical protein
MLNIDNIYLVYQLSATLYCAFVCMVLEKSGDIKNMKPKHFLLVARYILLIFILAACGPAATTAPSATTAATAVLPAPATAVPATSVPTPVAAVLTKSVPTTAAITSGSGSGGCANAYYPVPTGAVRSYSSTGSGLGDYTYTQTVTAASDTGFTTDLNFSTGVNYTIKWKCQGGNLAVLDAGAESFTMSTSKVKMTSDSITVVGYNIPAAFDAGKTWSEDVKVDGTVVQSGTGKTEKSQIASQTSCTAAGTDTVTVPAGKFDTVKASCVKKVTVSFLLQGTATPINSNTENITYWYAKGVGFVKSVATGGTDNETIVLTKYKIP